MRPMVNHAQDNGMTSKEKDSLCDGINFQPASNDFDLQQSRSTTLKRTATSEGQRFGDDPDDGQLTKGQGTCNPINKNANTEGSSHGGRAPAANIDARNSNSPKKSSTSITKYARGLRE